MFQDSALLKFSELQVSSMPRTVSVEYELPIANVLACRLCLFPLKGSLVLVIAFNLFSRAGFFCDMDLLYRVRLGPTRGPCRSVDFKEMCLSILLIHYIRLMSSRILASVRLYSARPARS